MGKNSTDTSPKGTIQQKGSSRFFIQRITISAICVALALILRLMSVMIPFGGMPTMRITLSGIFIAIPAMLFGAVIGGIAGGIVDVLGFLLDPQGGAFIPLLTITAVACGLFYGLLWKFLKNKPYKSFEITTIILLSATTIIGIINIIISNVLPSSGWSVTLAKLGNKSWYMLFGLVIIGLFGFLGLFSTRLFFKNKNGDEVKTLFVKVFITLFIVGCLITSINGYIIWTIYKIPYGFPLYWLLRIIKETATSIISAYVITFLYPIFTKFQIGK